VVREANAHDISRRGSLAAKIILTCSLTTHGIVSIESGSVFPAYPEPRPKVEGLDGIGLVEDRSLVG